MYICVLICVLYMYINMCIYYIRSNLVYNNTLSAAFKGNENREIVKGLKAGTQNDFLLRTQLPQCRQIILY